MTFSDFVSAHSVWFSETISGLCAVEDSDPTPVPTLRWLGVCSVPHDAYPYPLGVDLDALATQAGPSTGADDFTVWFFVTPSGEPNALIMANISGHPTWDVI